jgi:hypothetical protein
LTSQAKPVKEKELCKAFYRQYQSLRLYNQFKNNALVFHIANEQNCSKAYTLQLKRMGLLPGVADYCILLKGCRVAFLEFKRDKKSKQSINQRNFELECYDLSIPYLLTHDVDKALSWIQAL